MSFQSLNFVFPSDEERAVQLYLFTEEDGHEGRRLRRQRVVLPGQHTSRIPFYSHRGTRSLFWISSASCPLKRGSRDFQSSQFKAKLLHISLVL